MPPEHQSRSKRLASKMLKKLGTKERFRNPQADQSGKAKAALQDAWHQRRFQSDTKNSTIVLSSSSIASCKHKLDVVNFGAHCSQ